MAKKVSFILYIPPAILYIINGQRKVKEIGARSFFIFLWTFVGAIILFVFVSIAILTTPTQNCFEVDILHHHIELVVLYTPICIDVHLPYHFSCHFNIEVFVEGEHFQQLVR